MNKNQKFHQKRKTCCCFIDRMHFLLPSVSLEIRLFIQYDKSLASTHYTLHIVDEWLVLLINDIRINQSVILSKIKFVNCVACQKCKYNLHKSTIWFGLEEGIPEQWYFWSGIIELYVHFENIGSNPFRIHSHLHSLEIWFLNWKLSLRKCVFIDLISQFCTINSSMLESASMPT